MVKRGSPGWGRLGTVYNLSKIKIVKRPLPSICHCHQDSLQHTLSQVCFRIVPSPIGLAAKNQGVGRQNTPHRLRKSFEKFGLVFSLPPIRIKHGTKKHKRGARDSNPQPWLCKSYRDRRATRYHCANPPMLLVRISAFFAEVGNNIKYQILDLETERLFFFCCFGT